jgi:condensation domain-containing protein
MSSEPDRQPRAFDRIIRIYPASIGQRVWAMHFAERRGDEPFFATLSLRLTGRLDAAALQRSFSAVVARHEALRTTLYLNHGQVLQVVSAGAKFWLGQVDLTGIPECERERVAVELTSRESPIRPGINNPRFFHVRLIKLDTAAHVLTLTTAEAICDGPSRNLFWGELRRFYEAEIQGGRSSIDPPPRQYGEFAIWQSKQLQRPEVLRQRDHWLKLRAYATDETLPIAERPRPPGRSFGAGQFAVGIQATARRALSAIAAQRGATLFMALAATICALIKSQTNIDHVTVGSAADYRYHPKFHGVIGMFAASFLFCVDLSGDPTFLDFVDRVRDATLEAYQNQEFPLELAIKESDPGRNLYLRPPFAIKIVLQQEGPGGGGLSDLQIEAFGPNMAKARYDLIISLVDQVHELTGTITYNTDLFSATGVRYTINRWYRLIDRVIQNPESMVRDLSDVVTMSPLSL